MLNILCARHCMVSPGQTRRTAIVWSGLIPHFENVAGRKSRLATKGGRASVHVRGYAGYWTTTR